MSEEAVQAVKKDSLPIQITRRETLKTLLGIVGACGAAGISYGTYRFLAPGGAESVEVPLSAVAAGTTYHFQYGGAPGILFRGEDESFRAFSLVCTHLACTVQWKPERNEFYCPCHDGFFDAEGKVLSGPPPAPLERLRVEVKGDKVIIA